MDGTEVCFEPNRASRLEFRNRMLSIFEHPRAVPAARRLERHYFQDHISHPRAATVLPIMSSQARWEIRAPGERYLRRLFVAGAPGCRNYCTKS